MFLPEVPVAFEACDQLFIDGEDGRCAILGVEPSHMTKQPRIYGHANMLHDEFQNSTVYVETDDEHTTCT